MRHRSARNLVARALYEGYERDWERHRFMLLSADLAIKALTDRPAGFHLSTVKRTDGEPIFGEYDWATNPNAAELDVDGSEVPIEYVEERWVRFAARTFWAFPDDGGGCEIEDEEECEEDSSAWWRSPDGVWLRVCGRHLDLLGGTVST